VLSDDFDLFVLAPLDTCAAYTYIDVYKYIASLLPWLVVSRPDTCAAYAFIYVYIYTASLLPLAGLVVLTPSDTCAACAPIHVIDEPRPAPPLCLLVQPCESNF